MYVYRSTVAGIYLETGLAVICNISHKLIIYITRYDQIVHFLIYVDT